MRADRIIYRFGDFTLQPGERGLLRGEVDVPLRPKAFQTLLHLVERRGRTVAKEELLEVVWPDTHVSEGVLTHCISEIRQALGDDARRPRFVKTISLTGYKFTAQVHTSGGADEAAPTGPNGLSAGATAIAVLPFTNLSADPRNEYFCDGLSEELINALTKVPGLRVVAHSSSFYFKGCDIDAREIGRRLDVGSILEGSVRKTGNRIRISAQLIDAAVGYHLWSEQYDRRLDDLFAVQEEISTAILDKLKVGFAVRPGRPLFGPRTGNMEAYLLYLQGRACWHRRFSGFLQKAIDCFRRAIDEDPGFALPYTGLADAYTSLGVWAFAPAAAVFPKAAALADRALEIDKDLAEAHATRAFIDAFYEWAWERAGRGFSRALSLNPGSALIHLWAGHYFSIVGHDEEAIAEVLCAQSLDPLSPVVSANVGWTFYLARQPELAIRELRKVLDMDPGNGTAHFYSGYVYVELGRLEEAIESFRAAIAATGGMPWAAESIGWVQGLLGRTSEARGSLREAEARSRAGYVPSSAPALVHLGLGDDDSAFALLRRGVEERDALLPWTKSIPALDRLRPDPRFQELLARVGLAEKT